MKKLIVLLSLLILGFGLNAQNVVRYKWVAIVTSDGQKLKPYQELVYYLSFDSSKSSFFICDADGYRSLNNGGFAGREIPAGGTGVANKGFYPINYTYQSQDSNGIITYMDQRPILGSYNRIEGYTYDVFRFSSDYSRLNVKVERTYGSPFFIQDANSTYVYEMMGNPANSGGTFY